MKKLLFIYYKLNLPGGIARVLTNLANELVDEYEVSILILVKDKTSFYHLDERVKIISVDSYQHWAFTKGCVGMNRYFSWLPKKNSIKGYLYDFGAYQTLNQWLKENHRDYDTIITCQYKLSIGLAQNLELAKKTIAWEHNPYNSGGIIFNRLRVKFFKNLKKVVAINVPGKKYYLSIKANTCQIYNLMSHDYENIKNLELHKKKNLIVLVANLAPEKNIIEFLQIIKDTNLYPDWQVQIMGNGKEFNYLADYIENHKLENKVKMLGAGSGDDVLNLITKSKITCLTSVNEALPTVLIESMMCGNALISYDCNYGPSDIINKNNGFLIPLHDKKMFQEKLEYLTQNPIVLESLMKSSFEESKKWKKEKMINQWIEIL